MKPQLKRWGKLSRWGWEIGLAYCITVGFVAVAFIATVWSLRKIWMQSPLWLAVLVLVLWGLPLWICTWATKKLVLRAPWRVKRYARVFLVCVLVTWITSHVAGQWMLRRELSAWHAAGLRTSPDEYVSRGLRPEQNAATVYRGAMAKLISVSEHVDFIEAWRRNDIVRASELLAASQTTREALADARAGSRIAECDWGPIYYGDNYSHEVTDPAMTLRGLAERLVGEAQLAARSGDRQLALEDIAAALRLAVHARQSVVIFGTGCAPSITSMAACAMKDSLRGNEERLDELEGSLTSLDLAPLILRCSREESALSWDWFTRVVGGPRVVLAVLSFDAWNHWAHLVYLRERAETRSGLPMLEWPVSPPLPWWAVEARVAMVFAMEEYEDMVHWPSMGLETNRRQAILAIRLAQHHRQHGEYPANLTELGFSLSDPFIETAMKYERTSDGGFKLTAWPEAPTKKPIVWEWARW